MDRSDLGLGLINGLQQGLMAYQQSSDRRKDRESADKDKQLQMNILKAEKGLIQTPDGQLTVDPNFKKVQDAEAIRQLRDKALLEGRTLQLDDSGHPIAAPYTQQQLDYERNKKKSEAGPDLTPGQKKVDEKFATDYNDYQLQGGKATVDKNLGLLQGAADTLANKPGLTGNWTQKVPILNSDAIQSTINPDSIRVRDDIRGAVQASLRQTLGSQFTEREGEAIFNRSYDPKLSADENIRRVKNVIGELRQNSEAKESAGKYYEGKGQGSLKGFAPSRGLIGTSPQSSGPRPGEVHDGYQFKGGNPADPNSWSKVN